MLESHTNFVSLHDQRNASEESTVGDGDLEELIKYAHVATATADQAVSEKGPEQTIQVRDLTRHMRNEDLHSLVHRYLRIEKPALTTARELISPPIKVSTNPRKGLWEHVSDLSGIAITAAFNNTTVGDILKDECDRAVWFAKQAALDEAEDSGYQFRWLQLGKQHWNRFGWLIGVLDRAVERIAGEVTQEGKIAMKDLQHEQELGSSFTVSIPGWDKPAIIEIRGRADIIFNPKDGSRATIWEIKLVKSFKLDHIAQTVQYGLLWAITHPDAPFPRLLLFNVLDGERWEISTTKEEAQEFVEGVIRTKRTRTKLTDDEFRSQCESTSDEAQAIVDRMP